MKPDAVETVPLQGAQSQGAQSPAEGSVAAASVPPPASGLGRLLASVPLRPGTAAGVLSAVMVLICAEFVRSGFYMGYLGRVIESAYHLPVSVVGAAWSAHLTTDTIMRGPAGILLQRYGPRQVVLAGAALCLLALASWWQSRR